jgi:CheY-like chemotaxis protein
VDGKPLSTIAEELNNVLTVIAMCTDELEGDAAHLQPLADMRDAIQRGAVLTRRLWNHAKGEPESNPVLAAASETNVTSSRAPTVLVVEAEDEARAALGREIEGRGWRLIARATTDEAMQCLEGVRSIDLVVVDSTLSGRRFAATLVERYPSADVLYTTSTVDRIAEALARRR